MLLRKEPWFFLMVIYVRVLFVEYCDTHLVSWTDYECGQGSEWMWTREQSRGIRQCPITVAVSPRPDRVKQGYENNLQVYRVADRERETSWLEAECIEWVAVSKHISEQKEKIEINGPTRLVTARLAIALREKETSAISHEGQRGHA